MTCLSGTAVLVRLDALFTVFGTCVREALSKTPNLHEHWRCHFGGDRRLTELLSAEYGPWSTDIHTGVVVETQAALPLATLIYQRRRWFLGSVAAEAAALCNPEIWNSTPVLSAYRLCLRPLRTDDLQMVLLVLATRLLQPQATTARILSAMLLSFCSATVLVLWMFDAVRPRFGLLMYLCIILVMPFINTATAICAVASLRDRQW